MAIIKNVTVNWVNANPTRGKRYQNKSSNPEKWDVQIVTRDKKVKEALAKEFGFSVKTDEDDAGIFYRTTLSCYTRNQDGELNRPIKSILANGAEVDPDTIGNGSVANLSFSVSGEGDDRRRRWKGIQVTKWVKYEPQDKDEFELSDELEIIGEDTKLDDDSDY